MQALILVLLALVGCTLFVIGIGFFATEVVRRREAGREMLWREFAEARGGFFVPATGSWLFRRPASIVVPHAHASVTIDIHVVSHGKSSTTYTRARARYALGFGPSFRVSSEGLLSAMGKALGAQDLSRSTTRRSTHASSSRASRSRRSASRGRRARVTQPSRSSVRTSPRTEARSSRWSSARSCTTTSSRR